MFDPSAYDLADLAMLDRDVARASTLVSRATPRLETEEGRRADSPLEVVRHVAIASTFRALADKPRPPHEVLHQSALLRWIHELLQSRIDWDLAVAEASRRHAIDPTTRRVVRDGEPKADGGDAPIATFDAATKALHGATNARAIASSLSRIADLADPVVATRRERRARRFEAARRLDLAHPWSLALAPSTPPSALFQLASSLLDRTDAIAKELRNEDERKTGVRPSVAGTIDGAFARDAREGWPARLGARWCSEVFRALVDRPFSPSTASIVPTGAASFLRAAWGWGEARRFAGTARSLPFALARDPYADDAARFGAALALTVADPVFQRRALGLTQRIAQAQARTLERALLFSLRLAAWRVVLAEGPAIDEAAFGDQSFRVFGAPLDGSLAYVVPSLRVADVGRLLGAVRAFGFVRELVDRFDEDWFANPRAGAHLASIFAGPVFAGLIGAEDEDASSAATSAAERIGRRFEEELG